MKYCKLCLQTDTRPNIIFNEHGICPACTYFKESNSINWKERAETLSEICKNIKRYKPNNSFFDCIIGVSGGKDSTRQALFVRDKLKLNPLLVCLSYPPQQVSERGVKNISNLINLGFDCIFIGPAPETWRLLLKQSFLKFCNWCKSTELSLFSSVPQQAIKYNIPTIFWGENPGLQLGDLKTLGKNGYDGNNLRNMNTLNGGDLQWILDLGFKYNEIIPYCYPSLESFDKNNIKIIYLGWFFKDWSLLNNATYSCLNGLNIHEDPVTKTGDLYGVSALDENWVPLNQMIKYYKYGFGRTTDYVNEEIRLQRMSRAEGIELISKYDGCCAPETIKSFCKYIDLSIDDFWKIVHKNVNKDLFYIDNNKNIIRKFEIG